jgi:hypothetical protein
LVTSCVGTALCKNVIEGKIEGRIEVLGWRGRRRDHILDYPKWKMERESSRSRSVTNSVWKRQWTCCKTDYGIKCVSVLWYLELTATSCLSNTQSLNCYGNVSRCCDMYLSVPLQPPSSSLSFSLLWRLYVPLQPPLSCQSVNQSVYHDVCLSPYSHLLPVSQSVIQSVYYDVCISPSSYLSVRILWCLFVPLQPRSSCQSVSQSSYYDICLSPYSHLLPVSQSTMMSVYPLTATFFLSVSQSVSQSSVSQ